MAEENFADDHTVQMSSAFAIVVTKGATVHFAELGTKERVLRCLREVVVFHAKHHRKREIDDIERTASRKAWQADSAFGWPICSMQSGKVIEFCV